MKNYSQNWIWCSGDIPEKNVHAAFRKRFVLDSVPVECELLIGADSIYRLWINNRLVGVGSNFTNLEESTIDSYKIEEFLNPGENIIAVQVQYIGAGTAYYIPKAPGLCCSYISNDQSFCTDATWESRQLNEYSSELPRKNWALAFPEFLDKRNTEVWQTGETKFNWEKSLNIDCAKFGNFIKRTIPPIKLEYEKFENILSVWKTGIIKDDPKTISSDLDKEKLEELPVKSFKAGKELLSFEMVASEGRAFCIDLGRETTGYISISLETESEGILNVSSGELLQENSKRPWTCRRDCLSASQIKIGAGKTEWTSWDYTGFRYLYFVLRGFTGKVNIVEAGAVVRYADFPQPPEIKTSNKLLNNILEICERTIQLCSQDLLIDCPTREQAQYSGDLYVVAPMLAYMCGDTSYLRRGIEQAFQSINESGFINARYPSSADQVLYDYSLMPTIMLSQYYEFTGDNQFLEDNLKNAEKSILAFQPFIGETGCVELNGKLDYDKGIDCLFIDHPGLGWHDFDYPGIERDGISAGLNFFYILSLKSLSKIFEICGETQKSSVYAKKADFITKKSREIFWDSKQNRFADVLDKNNVLIGFSQQTNALAMVSGVATSENISVLLPQILEEENPKLCRCSSYFYYFLFEALMEKGEWKKCLEIIEKRWGDMIEKGATTTWESFDGGWKDSLCHAWSTAPLWIVLRYIAGIKITKPGFKEVTISPIFDAVDSMNCGIKTPYGDVDIFWDKENYEVDSPENVNVKMNYKNVEKLISLSHRDKL